ncbi:hypothetical protein EVAR_59808_1 [Eumeta japonica]|uniref:Uncharacterized protein n=1 Tax=Eumeta variegata TaxID=151549 RepID=A0A4C1YF34_EUMVA|nr:hypothetical protein EVAR_59808_1 [Eumeta japonica]
MPFVDSELPVSCAAAGSPARAADAEVGSRRDLAPRGARPHTPVRVFTPIWDRNGNNSGGQRRRACARAARAHQILKAGVSRRAPPSLVRETLAGAP